MGRGLAKVKCDAVWAKAQICHGCHCCLAMRRAAKEREVKKRKAKTVGRQKRRGKDQSKTQELGPHVPSCLHAANPHSCIFIHMEPEHKSTPSFYMKCVHVALFTYISTYLPPTPTPDHARNSTESPFAYVYTYNCYFQCICDTVIKLLEPSHP